MNKCKKAFSILAGFAAIISLSGCKDSVTESGNKMLSYTASDGTKVDFTTNDLLINYFENNSASTSEVYNIVYEALLKKYFDKEENKTDFENIKNLADNDVDEQKDTAQSNADSNSTSYKEEWEKILDTELSDLKDEKRTEKALYDKYLVKHMKEKVGDKFYDEFKDWNWRENNKNDESALKMQEKYNIFSGENGYIEKRIPYHVSHILIKVDATNNAFYNGEISADDATDLFNVIEPLAKGTSTFGTQAENLSEDTSSTSYGNLGIMDLATSFVNEFKLGIYIYDTLFNNNEAIANKANANPFNMPEDSKTYFEDLGVNFIPYGAFEEIFKYKDTTKDQNGLEVNEGNAAYYPRNILFNKYFNNHAMSFITADKTSTKAPTSHQDNFDNKYYTDLDENGKYELGNPITEDLKGFKEITFKNGETKKILCDEKGNPIIVVRAGTSDYQGVHFIVVNRSGLLEDDPTTETTLDEYFAAENPYTLAQSSVINPNFPQTEDGEPKITYINNTKSDYNTYNTRANTLKDTIKSFDSAYEMRVFQWLSESSINIDEITITYGENQKVEISDKLNKYVYRQIEETDSGYSINKDTWKDYELFLKNQNEQRKTKLIPETCAIGFSNGNNYEEGGICYYAK